MKRHTQAILYHLLPVVFWLLAIGGALLPVLVWTDLDGMTNQNYWFGFLVAAVVQLCILIISRIKRYTSSVEECFQVALLLGIASYWLPTVVFLIIPIWIYLVAQNLFSFHAFLSTLIGYTLVAIWAALFITQGWILNPWADFFVKENAVGWIPTGASIFAWLASAIARHALRSR